MQNVQVLRLEATQLVNQLPVEALQQAIDILKTFFDKKESIETKVTVQSLPEISRSKHTGRPTQKCAYSTWELNSYDL